MAEGEWLDEDGYPTEAALERIASWEPYDDLCGLLTFVRSLWYLGAWGWTEYRGRDRWRGWQTVYLVSTGGWSGNESLIEALQRHVIFWPMAWWESRRGGHYEFRLDDPTPKEEVRMAVKPPDGTTT